MRRVVDVVALVIVVAERVFDLSRRSYSRSSSCAIERSPDSLPCSSIAVVAVNHLPYDIESRTP